MSRRIALGVVVAVSAAACAFVIGVLVHDGLAEAAVWAGVVAALAAVLAAAAGIWAAMPRPPVVPPRPGPADDLPRRAQKPLPVVPGSPFAGYVPPLPSRFVTRAGVLDVARDRVLSHAVVALVGMGGAGKTVLATAVAHDPAVQAAFPDGIAWVDAGQQAAPVQLQERLAAQLTGETVAFPSVEAGRNRLAEIIASRSLLLVIDDVWDPKDLSALNVIGPQGAVLFTTRDAGISLAAGATACQVDSLTLEQALTLLGHWASTDFGNLPPEADSLCLRVGNLALGVAIAGGMVCSRGAQPQAWQEVLHLLEPARIDAIRAEYGPDNYKYAGVLSSITVSIDDLDPGDRDRYRELAVFAGRGAVPPAAVSALWEWQEWDRADSEILLARLSGRSLLQRDPRGWILLHDLQYEVAAHQLAALPAGVAGAHGRLIDGYGRCCQSSPEGEVTAASQRDRGRWASGPDDGYFFQNLAYHLAQAGRSGELDRLLTDFGWLRRKLSVAGISLLLADYTHQARQPDVDVVRAALQLSVPVLAADPSMLAGQLVGRLLNQHGKNVKALIGAARRWDGQPWLCPSTPGSLTEPGGPLEQVLEGHTGWVSAVAVTPDGQHIISGSGDHTMRVWNLATGRPERTLEGRANAVSAVAVTPDGQRIISDGDDNSVRVWNLASGRAERTLDGHTGPVSAVAVTPDGRRIISGGFDQTVRVWNLATGCPEQTLDGHTGYVHAVAVTPDGQRIISGSFDQTVRVWNLAATGRAERTPDGHGRPVSAVAVTPDGRRVVSGGDDNSVRVWDLATGRAERTLDGHTGPVSAVAVTPDGRRVVSGGSDNSVRVWDLATGRAERTLDGHTRPVNAVAVTPDGQHIVSGGSDNSVRVWDLATGRAERTLDGHTSDIRAVAVTPDGQHIISGSGTMTQVYELATGHLERTLDSHTGYVHAVAVTPDGQRVISASGETLQVWDLADGTELAAWVTDGREVTSCAAQPRDSSIVAYGGSDGRVVVLSLRADPRAAPQASGLR